MAQPLCTNYIAPKGRRRIRGIGEKFAANPYRHWLDERADATPGRSGFGPQLSLSYDSGSGNGPFGFGWSLALPSITRKTDKGLPEYSTPRVGRFHPVRRRRPRPDLKRNRARQSGWRTLPRPRSHAVGGVNAKYNNDSALSPRIKGSSPASSAGRPDKPAKFLAVHLQGQHYDPIRKDTKLHPPDPQSSGPYANFQLADLSELG